MSHPVKITTPSDLEIRIERTFDAPAALVYEMFTQPEHVRRWWGGDYTKEMKVCDIDLRVGGKWRFVGTGGCEESMGDVEFYGEYLELDPPHRTVHTETFAPYPDFPTTVTTEFREENGQTHMTATVKHLTQESRDMHLNSGMEGGVISSYEHVDTLLAERVTA